MAEFDQYIDIVVDSCKSTITQMTNFKVNAAGRSLVMKDLGTLPFAHVIDYKDYDNELEGEFLLGFESVHDALKLASAIAERLGLNGFDKVNEDSMDVLSEFLTIVVGRTITEWDSLGFKFKFGTPVFRENHKRKNSKYLQGYTINIDIASDTVNLEEDNPSDQILFRVNFLKVVENTIENKKILLAEDSKVMRSIIAKVLKEHGAQVKEATNGEEAVQLHRSYGPDLTLMDINMPKLNGLEAIAQIKEFNPKAKFIILSSSSKKEQIISAKKTLQVSGYLVKPVEPDKLIERVSEAL